MVFQTFFRPRIPRNVLRLGALLLKILLFLPLPLLSQDRVVSTVTIPFAFSTGSHTMPAGDYVVHRVTECTYSLNADRGTAVQYVSVYHDYAISTPERGSLVFRKYGGQYFLSNLWFGGSHDGLKVRMGSAEKELIASARGVSQPSTLLAVDMGVPPQQ
jgi:hypothetical protein